MTESPKMKRPFWSVESHHMRQQKYEWTFRLFEKCFVGSLSQLFVELNYKKIDRSVVVLTPNLNHLRISNSNLQFKQTYVKADYLLADGMPVRWMSVFFRRRKVNRLSGVDLVNLMLKNSASFAVVGSSTTTVDAAQKKVGQPNCKIPVFDAQISTSVEAEDVESIRQFIKSVRKRYVLLALSAEKQLHLIEKLIRTDDDLNVIYIGVGGSFDIISGRFVRAPKFLQSIGMEWLWRALQNPRDLIPRYILDLLFLFHILPTLVLSKRKGWH